VFSTSVAVVLHIALREAVSRRHAYLTLEHLLYVLAHDAEGERILTAVGVDLARLRRDLGAYLDGSIEQMPRGQQPDEPEQTAAFRQVLQTAILHVQAAQRQEANAGDILAALMQQPKTYAARLLAEQGVTRLDILEYISHGVTKTPISLSPDDGVPDASAGEGEVSLDRAQTIMQGAPSCTFRYKFAPR